MKLIAGQFGGHGLKTPSGHQTRPSTARTREALFGLIDARIYLEGAEVLDLFSGTGALGLEAISRGAVLATFVEQKREVLDYARQNAEKLGVEDKCIFIQGDAVEYLRSYSGPDTDGVFTLEHSSHDWFDEHPHLMTSRSYGRTIVSLFRPPLPPERTETADEEGSTTAESSAR